MPLELEASMPLLLEIEGLSMPMLRGGGRSVNDDIGDACGGGGRGSVDEEARETCKGEGGGGGRLIDGVAANTSGLGGGGIIIRVRGLVNSESSDACGGKWEDSNHSLEAQANIESWWETFGT